VVDILFNINRLSFCLFVSCFIEKDEYQEEIWKVQEIFK
jgi:cob(I)alamin adenosyltransferase